MKGVVQIVAVILAGATLLPARGAEEAPPKVQIALLLDTSNSMDGLIAQAKSELWRIVNEFATAKRAGVRPEFEVALYEYGNNGLAQETGWVRQVAPLTTDLDKVSEALFALKTNGGQEYCGQVIRAATEQLAWSASGRDYRAVFIAGNEPFTQGPADFREACRAAIARGILVNTIFCGPEAEGVRTNWKDGALLADGSFMHIDQNRTTVDVPTPQDGEIARLGEELSRTYIAYGAEGRAGQERQLRQEENARSASRGSYVQRQVSKATAFYKNEAWDLVDATKQGQVKLEEVKEKDLPEEMQKMSLEERKAFVAKNAAKRAALQDQVQKLNEQRKQFVAEQMKKQATASTDTLQTAVIKAVREQAGRKDFKFE